MIRIGLLRHGHTAWNRAGRIQGRTDIPLEDAAHSLLSGLTLPTGWETADLVSSPLSRAIQTAECVTGQTPRAEEALLEMDWGAWEGAETAALLADPASGFQPMEHWGWAFCPPGGERLSDLRDRILTWAEGVERDTVAVCHIGVMRVLVAHIFGWDFDGPAPFRIKRNRLFVIEKSDGKWSPHVAEERLTEASCVS